MTPSFKPVKPDDLSHAYAQVFMLGLTSMLVQIVMLREFMFIFGGNELILGVSLAQWMIWTGIGAFFGKKAGTLRPANPFTSKAMLWLGWLPPLLLFIVECFRNKIFKPGTEIGFFDIMISTAIILAPFCLLSGFLFTCLTGVVSHHNHKIPAEKTYAIESLGSLAAGMLSSFVLFFLLSNFQVMILLPLCTSLLLLFPLRKNGIRPWPVILLITTWACVILLFVVKADFKIKSCLFPQQEVLFLKDTPYGNLAVTKSAGQLNIFDNGKLLFSTDNQIANEEAVHYAMAQHPLPRNVLLVSGGISGLTHEILKYDVEHIDYVEINPAIFTIGRKFTTSLADDRIHLIRQDARNFIKKAGRRYDMVLIQLPDPSTAQLNRFYTLEFLSQVKKIMHETGIAVLNMPPTANYLSPEAVRLNSVIFTTCNAVFENVLIIPGERNYFLLSDKPLTVNITQYIVNKEIKNDYLNSYYIDTLSLQERSQYLSGQLDPDAQINRDFKPVSYFYYIHYWLSQFKLGKNLMGIMFVVLIVLFTGAGILLKPSTAALMITGFSASSLEIILLLGFQILSGYIYQAIGVCMAVFMGGLALGAVSRRVVFRQPGRGGFIILPLAMAVIALLIPAILVTPVVQSGIAVTLLVVLLLLFVIAFAAGIVFSIAVQMRSGRLTDAVAALYSADLIGSAIGAFLTSVFLIPLLGIMNTAYLTGTLLLLFALYLFIRRKHLS